MTKFFKGRSKVAKQTAPIPRALEEIKAEYEGLRNRSGDLQYQIYAIKQDLEKINQALVNVNYEAAARQKLDAEAAAKVEETKNEQV